MNEKISLRSSGAISSSQEKRKYVLADVFWVPLSSYRRSSSSVLPELRSEEPDLGEVSDSGENESGSANNPDKS